LYERLGETGHAAETHLAAVFAYINAGSAYSAEQQLAHARAAETLFKQLGDARQATMAQTATFHVALNMLHTTEGLELTSRRLALLEGEADNRLYAATLWQ